MKNFPWGTIIVLFVLYWLWQGGFFSSLFSGTTTIPIANTPIASTVPSVTNWPKITSWSAGSTCNSGNTTGCPSGFVIP